MDPQFEDRVALVTGRSRGIGSRPCRRPPREAQASPLGPEAVVPAIAFLGSPANVGVTGELVRVTGGR